MEQITSVETALTGVVPFYYKDGEDGIGVLVTLPECMISTPGSANYGRTIPLDLSGDFDTVTIWHAGLGISAKAKVVRTEFDVLAERYTAIDLGESKRGLDSTIADLWKRRQ